MMVLKKRPKTFAVLAIAFIVGAFLVASWLWPASIDNNWVGICVHSLSADDARLVSESGAGWIRIDASDNLSDFGGAVRNAKSHNLKVLGILDSWMFNKSSTFTLEQWCGNVTYYVSQYADYVDAWEIWNEPASPIYPLLDLNLTNAESQQNMSTIIDFYYSMVQTASPIIRQYDPTAKILLFGGLNLYSGANPHLALDKDFAGQLVAKNIQQYGDAISVHAYPWGQQNITIVQQSYDESLGYYRGLFNYSLEVWVTETGKPLEENGEAGQTHYMTDALGYFSGNVTRFFWYSLLDNTWDQGSFGLIGNGATPRAAYFELQKHL